MSLCVTTAKTKITGSRWLVLDTRKITVSKVELVLVLTGTFTATATFTPMTFSMSKEHEAYGTALKIDIPWELRVRQTNYVYYIEKEIHEFAFLSYFILFQILL